MVLPAFLTLKESPHQPSWEGRISEQPKAKTPQSTTVPLSSSAVFQVEKRLRLIYTSGLFKVLKWLLLSILLRFIVAFWGRGLANPLTQPYSDISPGDIYTYICTHEGRDFCLFTSLLLPKLLEQYLVDGKLSIK